MAITYVGASEDAYNSATAINSRTISVATGSRTNGLLIVGVSSYNNAPAQTPAITGITWGGTAMTEVTSRNYAVSSIDYYTSMYCIPIGSGGTQDVVVSFAATNVIRLHVVASWYDGALQTSPKDQSASGEGTTDPSVSITPSVDNTVIVSQYITENANVLSVGSGETGILSEDWGSQCTGSSYAIQTTAAAQTIDYTGTDDQWCMVVGSFKQAASSGTNIKINIGDTWKTVDAVKINIGDTWKTVTAAKINIGDLWKNIF